MENSDWGSDSSTDDEAFRELAIRCIIQFRAGHGEERRLHVVNVGA